MKRWLCLALALLLLLLCGCRSDVRPVGVSAGRASTTTADTPPPSKQAGNPTVATASAASATKTTPSTAAPPSAPASEEMRGVWISYYEIDALLSGKTPDTAGAAIDGMMKACASYGLNTVFFHVRGNSDAYYASAAYPAAASVKALLDKGFDPLKRAVDAAHRYGLKLHAWINPYRVGKDKTRARVDKIFSYQDTFYYMPHEAAVQQLVVKGVKEVVDGYAVDGVQFDDYFYPLGALPEQEPASFEKSGYAAYQKQRGSQAGSVADWRRSGVDALIRDVYKTVHTRPGCVFGVSPGADADKDKNGMYADVTGWMNRTDRIDYICPQVYYGFENETAPFHEVAERWRTYPRKASVSLYVGLALYKVGQEDTYAGVGADEWQTHDSVIARSVNWLRTRKDCGGFAFFSYQYFTPASCGLSKDARQIAEREVEQVLALMR